MKSAKEIKREISKLGPMLPGKIGRRSYECGNTNCKCMRKENPEKHGPYNQLSFTFASKSSTMNIKDKDLEIAQEYIQNYKDFQVLTKALVLAHVAEIRENGFKKRKK